uniref:Uncharacterized protein n=1 Tax=Arundo donax TaxID=35708 RepID=A0A0A9G9E0_ARUDO
MSSYKEGPGT